MSKDEWKMAFHTKKGLFEYMVMPFGLMNASTSFQGIMDMIFANIERVIWYINDTLIYEGTTEAEHQRIMEKVLAKCIEYGLAVNFTKLAFYYIEVNFLKYIINGLDIPMKSEKIETIKNWPISSHKKQVQCFLEFANY